MLNEKDEMKTSHICFVFSSQISQSYIFQHSRTKTAPMLFSEMHRFNHKYKIESSLDCALLCCRSRRKRPKHERTREKERKKENKIYCRKKYGERILKIPHKLPLIFKCGEKESLKFPTHYLQFSKQNLLPKRTTVSSACFVLS